MNKKAVILGAALSATVAATKPPRQQGKTEAAARQLDLLPDETLPKRLSIERSSPHYTSCGQYIGVKLDGEDVNGRVIEYNVVMGWVRLAPAEASGKALTRADIAAAEQRHGKVEVYWRMTPSRQVRRQLARLSA